MAEDGQFSAWRGRPRDAERGVVHVEPSLHRRGGRRASKLRGGLERVSLVSRLIADQGLLEPGRGGLHQRPVLHVDDRVHGRRCVGDYLSIGD